MQDIRTKTNRTLFKEFAIKHKTALVRSSLVLVTVVLAVNASKRAVNKEHQGFRDEMLNGDFLIPLKDNRYVSIPVMFDRSVQA